MVGRSGYNVCVVFEVWWRRYLREVVGEEFRRLWVLLQGVGQEGDASAPEGVLAVVEW